MDRHELLHLAEQLVSGGLTPAKFAELAALRLSAGVATLQTASIDLDRKRRCGFPEVVYGEGKPVETLAEIFTTLSDAGENVLATRVTAENAKRLLEIFSDARYNSLARTFRIDALPIAEDKIAARPSVAVVTAGTSDLPVAEEAHETLDWMGVRTKLIHDVGVAGPHRLPARLAELADSAAVVVVAGMEGALPSVVGGYVNCPVVAVPTSVGYGANLNGIAALLSMLNSCASNVAVVNIDAGFKGGYLAGMIAKQSQLRS